MSARTFESFLLETSSEVRELSEDSAVEELKEQLKKVEIEGEIFHVAEGDMLLDDDQVRVYAAKRKAEKIGRLLGIAGIVDQSGELLGIRINNQVIRWPDIPLAYCVLRNSFVSQSDYELVVENMLRATADWENTCGVQFEYKRELDGSPITPNPPGVIFATRFFDFSQNDPESDPPIAASFFPTDPPSRRRLLIDPSYFTTDFDKVGVLRHELGHILGFRHEMIRSGAPPECPDESTANTFPFTAYDPRSVMHYFCGGVGTRTLAITELDRVGSQRLYGPPRNSIRFVQ